MPRNLLLADDSITIQKVVGITFAGEDFAIVSVDNGEDAVRKARELRPDIVLADVVMPKRNGYEVCETLKSDPELSDIPVLLLAGTFEAFDEGRARAVRADGHIAKPFESQALINKVRELLEQRGRPEPRVASSTATGAREDTRAPAVSRGVPAMTPAGASGPAPAKAPLPNVPPPPFEAPEGSDAVRAGGFSAQPSTVSTAPTSVPGFGSVAPNATSRAEPPLLTRQPSAPVSTKAPMVEAQPEVRASSDTNSTTADAFEGGWGGDEPPSAAASEPPAKRSAVPTAQTAGERSTPELDWAALGFETDAAARAVAAPSAAGVLPAPGPRVPAPTSPSSPTGRPSAPPVTTSPELLPFGEPIDLADLEVEEPSSEEILQREAPKAPARVAPELERAPARGEGTERPSRGGDLPRGDVSVQASEPRTEVPIRDGGEAMLREALSRASREVIERIAWEIIPELAETIIREHVERLVKQREK